MTQTVLYYTDSEGFGGAEQALLTLLGGLDRTCWRPVLIHQAHPELQLLEKRARDLDVPTRGFRPLPGSRDWRWLWRFVREIRGEGTAVFHAHSAWPLRCTYGLVAAALSRVPAVVVTQHAFGKVAPGHDARMHRMVSAGVDRYIAVSENLARELRRYVFSERKVIVIRNAVALTPFPGAACRAVRRELTRGVERPIVLTLARLDKLKGLNYLIEAAAVVPDALFVVAGAGSERARLVEQARSAGVAERVLFLGQREDAAHLLGACDLFVLPSLLEGLPLSVLEAMAAGKPVVASRAGGTDEAVVDGITGFLVPPGDAEALGAAIRKVLADRALSEQLGIAGRARIATEFSVPAMIERTTRTYEELLSRQRAGTAAA